MRYGLSSALISVVVLISATTPAAAEKESYELERSLPGQTKCGIELPGKLQNVDVKWSPQEKWAWERICLGEVADLSDFAQFSCDPKHSENWPDGIILSKRFLRTLIHPRYQSRIPDRGISILCARFIERPNLEHATLHRSLNLSRSRFDKGANFNHLKVSGYLRLHKSTFKGRLDASGLEVANDLSMHHATFEDVVFDGSKVGGAVELVDSIFNGTLRVAVMEVAQSMWMVRSTFEEVTLFGTQVGGFLSMVGATFNGRLRAEVLNVGHSLHMGSNASFNDVNLSSAKIGRHLILSGSVFHGRVDLTNAEIRGEVRLASPLRPEKQTADEKDGSVPIWKEDSQLILRNVHAGALQDSEGAWKGLDAGQLDLVGFTYERLSGLTASEISILSERPLEWLLQWLAKQKDRDKAFFLQPYMQLAKILRENGQDAKAVEILYMAKDHQRHHALTPISTKLWLTVNYAVIGYGYKVWLALVWLGGLVLIGALLLCVTNAGSARGFWRCLFYSVDKAVPIVELSKQHEQLSRELPAGIDHYFQVHQILSFILVSFLAAGLAGLVG